MAHGSSGPGGHPVVSREEWLAARTAFLAKEKEFTRLRDEVSRQRRQLPWVKVEQRYVFDGPTGQETLADLFAGRSQLAVYHFMFDPKSAAGCPHCSFWADHYDGMGVHLNHRDVALVVVSRAPLAKITEFKQRMGWQFKWVSSNGNGFNYDYHVSFTPEEVRDGGFYNYAPKARVGSEREGFSAFYKDADGAVYHTYSTYARGIDLLNGTYNVLDLMPKGRDEDGLEFSQAWVRHHDRYES
jgi:predicted dithiol-disulfide oxidoreductase (DUF899 family)